MIEFLAGSTVLLLALMGAIQLSLVWAGQGAVETAAHFAARKFALHARTDLRKAKEAALVEAATMCLHRPGGRWSKAQLTSIDFSRQESGKPPQAPRAGDAYRLLLTHGVELSVPWANRILYAIAPVKKARIRDQYFLLLQTSRLVTVE